MSDADDTRATYDTVATHYAETYAGDLAEKVLDRALLGAFAEMVRARAVDGPRRVGDLGCGPGFEARHLAELGVGATIRGIDLSPNMIEEARRRHDGVAELSFEVGSLLALPFADGALAGALAIYSIIHLPPLDRPRAYAEIARVLAPGAVLLASFHVSAEGFPAGSTRRLETWWGEAVKLDGHFLAIEEVLPGLAAAGLEPFAKLERGPATPHEFPSQRCYVLARR